MAPTDKHTTLLSPVQLSHGRGRVQLSHGRVDLSKCTLGQICSAWRLFRKFRNSWRHFAAFSRSWRLAWLAGGPAFGRSGSLSLRLAFLWSLVSITNTAAALRLSWAHRN